MVGFLIAIYTKRGIERSIILIFSVSTVVTERDSRVVFSNTSKLLTLKTTNNKFFVLFTMVVFSKRSIPSVNKSELILEWQDILMMGSGFRLTDE